MARPINERTAPKMIAAARFVADNPGCTKLAAAEDVGPNGSRRFGYEIVDRAIKAGLIRAESGRGNSYRLFAE